MFMPMQIGSGKLSRTIVLLLMGFLCFPHDPLLAQDISAGNTASVFLPLITTGTAESADSVQTPRQVEGLISRLQVTDRQDFGHFLITDASGFFAVVGESLSVEQQLEELSANTSFARIKVWGRRESNGARLQQNDETAQIFRPEIKTIDLIVVREFSITGEIRRSTPTPPPQPLPTATPTDEVFRGWKASYFNNRVLQGSPESIRDEAAVNFNWGVGGPTAGVRADNFSVRFERTLNLRPGYHKFTIEADDGVRLWINNQLYVDEWHGASGEVYETALFLDGGDYDFQIEYYEAGGSAHLRFWQQFIKQSDEWQATYFYGTELRNSTPVSRCEPNLGLSLNYKWGSGSPLVSKTIALTDQWSARWVGEFAFTQGNYVFEAHSNDGVRIFINRELVIDVWEDGEHRQKNTFFRVGADTHTITIEYYDEVGPGFLRVWWYKDNSVELVE
ncbi:hypothetical protein KFU94_24045 [Chloroflexi bacterium TSY]|nr:hypothetical protein [Chloroflexi bacterium TSY]